MIVGSNFLKPHWYTLKSKRRDAKNKGSQVSGEIQLQFTIVNSSNPAATEADILNKFKAVTSGSPGDEKEEEQALAQINSLEDDDDDLDEDTSDETDDVDPAKPETVEKRKKKLRLKKLKRKTKARAYELSGDSDVVGIVFLEIGKITDLPPERNGLSLLSIRCSSLD